MQVLVDSQGISKGAGFVAFSNAEEANKAVSFFFFDIICNVLMC